DVVFFFQAEDGIRDRNVTGVQTCALPISAYNMIGEGRDGGKSGEYNTVFYKRDVLTLKNQGQFWLSETPDIPGSISWNSGCKRICTWGNFSYSDNTSNTFYVYNT